MKKIEDFNIKKESSADEIVRQMESSGGFTAKDIGIAVNILEEMIKNKECLKFLSFPASITATGTRGIIRDMIKKKWFDVVIATCGSLDDDIARSFKEYYHGSFMLDDKELQKKGIQRLGNILVPKESYGLIVEEKLREWLPEIYKEKKDIATYELNWELGKRLNENSILYWAWKNQVPVIVPGITDGTVGYQLWEFWQDHKDFRVNVLKDEQLLSDLAWNAKSSGALIIGGGITKHHVLWWAQFANGLDYAVYITTALEWSGSLSGAEPREAVSWGKIKENAKYVCVHAEVTSVLPLMYTALLQRLEI